MQSHWIRVDPNPITITGILIKRGKFRHRQTQGRMLCDNGGKGWSDAATTQGIPGIVSHQQKLGRCKKGSSCRVYRESIALPAH